ncbi:MAG: bifunctional (p)ppGpp synthetase/guanosine-3',5'-bis(diphosphate) 3'-pyrophosphohydrolase [bacterium]|nr:bifunctional (p)ppGpp synthetase/guanosine-3',5'-bis(diphosphate) 3'-pyrophosphohydrolase [bacterium]
MAETSAQRPPSSQIPGSEAPLAGVISRFLHHHPRGDVELLRRAFGVADEAHRGQSRKSGDPFIVHPLTVTRILADLGMDTATLAAGLLHDTLEDTDLSYRDVKKAFGAEIADLIDGVTKLDRITYPNREEAQAATIRKMVVAMARDVRVLVIKLCDRLHNMRTVSALRSSKQKAVATETLDVYAPLAHRLGIQEIKHELEDRCLAILHPGPYAEIDAKLLNLAPERGVVIDKMIEEVSGVLSDADIPTEVSGRPKHHYSIYRKMMETGKQFEEIYDLIGIRVVVPRIRDCYATLGEIHSHWQPLSGRFKDFIAMPKINLYQSLHTTVVGTDGKAIEIQIRTTEMHQLAERGIAAHWRYKEGHGAVDLEWVGDLGGLREEFEDPREFLDHLKLDLYRDEVFVITPRGEVKSFPAGATPVDFAYAIHTEVGDRCVGARINGRLLPLSTPLASGDIVEVITSRSQGGGPSRDWLKTVQTSRARSKIKQWFSKERRSLSIAEGREVLLAELRKAKLGLTAAGRDRLLASIAADLGKSEIDHLFLAVGQGEMSPSTVIQRLERAVNPTLPEEKEKMTLLTPPVSRRRTDTDGPGVLVEGMGDTMVKLARCCAPVPSDNIIGYVTTGRGVSVHSTECTNLRVSTPGMERMVEVAWSPDLINSFTVWVQVEALDRYRLLRDVTAVISEMGGNIVAATSAVGDDRVAVLQYEVELSDAGQLRRLFSDLRGVDGVFKAFRITSDAPS